MRSGQKLFWLLSHGFVNLRFILYVIAKVRPSICPLRRPLIGFLFLSFTALVTVLELVAPGGPIAIAPSRTSQALCSHTPVVWVCGFHALFFQTMFVTACVAVWLFCHSIVATSHSLWPLFALTGVTTWFAQLSRFNSPAVLIGKFFVRLVVFLPPSLVSIPSFLAVNRPIFPCPVPTADFVAQLSIYTI